VSPDSTLSTISRPGKVIAVGRNYAAHARELGNAPTAAPFFFLKASSTAIGTQEPIVIPFDVEGEVHHEAELAVILGLGGRRIPEGEAMGHVLGYCCANDVTARTEQKSLQERKLPWFGAKNADSFLCLGPGLTLRDSIPDPGVLRVRCLVDGEVRQDASTAEMIHGVASLIAHASRRVTLDPGDVILTGTPAGTGPIRPGQTVEVVIDGIGALVNPVVREVRPA
jgi:2-keto-4-pentenoate hydratase/2-oxohepta-3-ene-1,7-dioic acid hydratase in catechol pathway